MTVSLVVTSFSRLIELLHQNYFNIVISGVIPQAVADIFNYIDMHEDKFIFKVNVSFMELYQEQCYDLLSGKERGHSVIEIREDINKGVILPGKFRNIIYYFATMQFIKM